MELEPVYALKALNRALTNTVFSLKPDLLTHQIGTKILYNQNSNHAHVLHPPNLRYIFFGFDLSTKVNLKNL